MNPLSLPTTSAGTVKFNDGQEHDLGIMEQVCRREMIKGAVITGTASVAGLLLANFAINRVFPAWKDRYFTGKLILGTVFAYGAADWGASRASCDCVRRNLQQIHPKPIAHRIQGAGPGLSVITGVQNSTAPLPFTFRDNTKIAASGQQNPPNPRDEARDTAMQQLPKPTIK